MYSGGEYLKGTNTFLEICVDAKKCPKSLKYVHSLNTVVPNSLVALLVVSYVYNHTLRVVCGCVCVATWCLVSFSSFGCVQLRSRDSGAISKYYRTFRDNSGLELGTWEKIKKKKRNLFEYGTRKRQNCAKITNKNLHKRVQCAPGPTECEMNERDSVDR